MAEEEEWSSSDRKGGGLIPFPCSPRVEVSSGKILNWCECMRLFTPAPDKQVAVTATMRKHGQPQQDVFNSCNLQVYLYVHFNLQTYRKTNCRDSKVIFQAAFTTYLLICGVYLASPWSQSSDILIKGQRLEDESLPGISKARVWSNFVVPLPLYLCTWQNVRLVIKQQLIFCRKTTPSLMSWPKRFKSSHVLAMFCQHGFLGGASEVTGFSKPFWKFLFYFSKCAII